MSTKKSNSRLKNLEHGKTMKLIKITELFPGAFVL